MLRPNRHLGSYCNLRLSAAWPAPHAGLHWSAITARDGFFKPLVSIPSGYAAPQHGGIPALQSGSMASYRRPVLSLDGTADGALGMGMEAAAAISVLAEATGGLIAGGVASATLIIGGSADIVAAIAGSAAATITLEALADASALGFGAAAAVISVTAAGQPMGRGFMVATTVDTSTLTRESIAQAVWEYLAALANAPGTMGAKLNAAGSGGVDTGALADAILARSLAGGADGGRTVRDALRASRNRVVISGSTLTVYAEDDTTPAWTATITTAQRDALQGVDPA